MENASEGEWSRGRGHGVNRKFFLPRLPQEYYQGDAVVHWTLTIARSQTGWLNDAFHASFREILLHTAVRQSLLCPVYCLMPDHMHLIWMGLQVSSHQRRAMKFFRQHLYIHLQPFEFQHQPHDHVLREKKRTRGAFEKVCFYIMNNPRKAGLLDLNDRWPFGGAIVPGYPTLHPEQEDYWRIFWEIYFTKRAPDAGNIKRPPV